AWQRCGGYSLPSSAGCAARGLDQAVLDAEGSSAGAAPRVFMGRDAAGTSGCGARLRRVGARQAQVNWPADVHKIATEDAAVLALSRWSLEKRRAVRSGSHCKAIAKIVIVLFATRLPTPQPCRNELELVRQIVTSGMPR